MQILQPPDWPGPKGYSNGIAARGKLVFVAGQIGWDRNNMILGDNLVDQVRQAPENTIAVLAEANAGPERMTRMSWYVVDKQEYLSSRKDTGRVYREIMGRNYPAMSLPAVSALLEDRAKVEIETTAVIPD